MKKFSKIFAALVVAASCVFVSGCKDEDGSDIAYMSANIDGAGFGAFAGAYVSDGNSKADKNANAISKIVKEIVGDSGTVIAAYRSKDGVKETLVVAYAGSEARTYGCGINNGGLQNAAVDSLIDILEGRSVASTLESATKNLIGANITYIREDSTNGKKIYTSKNCTVKITGQTNATKLSLINGTFSGTLVTKDSLSSIEIKNGELRNIIGL